MVELDADRLSTRELNLRLRELARAGEEVRVENPGSRHNLGVAVTDSCRITLAGSVGYYCGGLNGGADFVVEGNAGWAVGENQTTGSIVVRRNAGSAVGASLRGGSIVVHGDCGPRAGIYQKGGTILVAGNAGYSAGFMSQAGVLIVVGDVADDVGSSLFEGVIFVGGRLRALGADAVVSEPTDEDEALLATELAAAGIEGSFDWKKLVAGQKLWYFDKKEWEIWRTI